MNIVCLANRSNVSAGPPSALSYEGIIECTRTGRRWRVHERFVDTRRFAYGTSTRRKTTLSAPWDGDVGVFVGNVGPTRRGIRGFRSGRKRQRVEKTLASAASVDFRVLSANTECEVSLAIDAELKTAYTRDIIISHTWWFTPTESSIMWSTACRCPFSCSLCWTVKPTNTY